MILNIKNLNPLTQKSYLKLDKLLAKKSRNVIKAYFPDADLRCGFQGLTALMLASGYDPKTLDHGEMILFTNRSKTALKLYAGGDVLIYQKAPEGRRVIYSAILAIPRYFDGRECNLDGAIKEAVRHDHDQRLWKKTGIAPSAEPAKKAK